MAAVSRQEHLGGPAPKSQRSAGPDPSVSFTALAHPDVISGGCHPGDSKGSGRLLRVALPAEPGEGRPASIWLV